MDTPSLGTITFGDKIISDLSQDGLAVFRRDHCGFVFQQIYLIEGMSVMDNVLCAGLLVNKDKKALVEKAKQLFAAVDISEDTQKKFPTQISGGEAQRVGIVRALINSPEILFADEPTGALDSRTGRDVLGLLQDLHDEGNTIVLITHDNSIARQAQRIIRLEDGKVVYDGPSDGRQAVVNPEEAMIS